MSLETNFNNAVVHYLVGVTFSLTDRLFSKNAKRKTQERLKEKLEQTESLYFLETNENKPEIESSKEYHLAVLQARNYFIAEKGISFEKNEQRGVRGLVERIAEKAKHYKDNERLNNLTAGKQFAFAYGLGLAADAGVALSRISIGAGHPLTALGHTSYQGLALFCGLQTGKGVLYIKDKLFKSKKEKELDRLASELTEDGKLLNLVKSYSPTMHLSTYEPEPEAKALPSGETEQSPLVDMGEKVGKTIADTAEGIGKNVRVGIDVIRQRLEQRRKAQAEAESKTKSELRKPYENY